MWQRKLRYLVTKFTTNLCSYLKLLQAVPPHCDHCDNWSYGLNVWVRCASGNVLLFRYEVLDFGISIMKKKYSPISLPHNFGNCVSCSKTRGHLKGCRVTPCNAECFPGPHFLGLQPTCSMIFLLFMGLGHSVSYVLKCSLS